MDNPLQEVLDKAYALIHAANQHKPLQKRAAALHRALLVLQHNIVRELEPTKPQARS